MINEIQFKGRVFDGAVAGTARKPEQKSVAAYGLRGALLGAVGFAGLLPLAVGAVAGTLAAPDLTVSVASGAIFGVITGGSIGAVIGGEGR
jgi:tetrahydromethanopterin S-methyltransferase subunit C